MVEEVVIFRAVKSACLGKLPFANLGLLGERGGEGKKGWRWISIGVRDGLYFKGGRVWYGMVCR